MKKPLAFLIGALGLAVTALVLVQQAKPEPSPIPTTVPQQSAPQADSNYALPTYTVPSGRLALQYPRERRITGPHIDLRSFKLIDGPPNGLRLEYPSSAGPTPDYFTSVIEVREQPNPQGLPIQEWLRFSPDYDTQEELETEYSLQVREVPVMVDGVRSLSQEFEGNGGSHKYLFIPLNGTVVIISFYTKFPHPDPMSADLQDFYHMVETVRVGQ